MKSIVALIIFGCLLGITESAYITGRVNYLEARVNSINQERIAKAQQDGKDLGNFIIEVGKETIK